MERAQADRFIRALHRLETDGDLEEIVSLFAPDAELRNPVIPRPLRGEEGVREFWDTYRRTFREVHSDFRKVAESDDTAILEWTSQGVTAQGREFRYDGVSVVEFADGRVRSFRAYFDPGGLAEEMAGRH